jgi:type I restriction enzyme S subunit
MALIKYKLGDLISLSDEKNGENKYKIEDVKGVSIKKAFIETKANMSGVSLTPYLIVKPDYFAYVPVTSRNGNKITIAHNDTTNTYIVSSSYIVFFVNHPDILDSDFLFMYFNRPEFDRYARYHSWGSAREVFSWDAMCGIEINLPSIEIQKKYVAVFKALLANNNGTDDVSKICPILVKGAIEEGGR